MAKAMLFVHNEKVPVRSQKYPHVNLSRSTTIFPTVAKEYLGRLGKGKAMKADIEDAELDGANERWIRNRMLLIPIGGELYRTKFNQEMETLAKWAKSGVSNSDRGEYNRRLNHLRKEAELFRERLFETGAIGKIVKSVSWLAEPNESEKDFQGSRSNLKKVTSLEQEGFRNKVTETLIMPMAAEELARELRMTTSNLRKRMRLLIRSGLVKSTTQRLSVGRPKVVYFLAHDI